MKDHLGRPLVAVTGIGLVSPLGWGLDKNWAALLAGTSGITRIRRFATDHLKTTMAGTVDLPEEIAGADPVPAPVRVERMAAAAIAEALVAAGMKEGAFDG
ncbi:MAG: beta-ketoacyl synthase N-terminal-like domain-containing protein, partial [Alphaproteobacteria bacterium]